MSLRDTKTARLLAFVCVVSISGSVLADITPTGRVDIIGGDPNNDGPLAPVVGDLILTEDDDVEVSDGSNLLIDGGSLLSTGFLTTTGVGTGNIQITGGGTRVNILGDGNRIDIRQFGQIDILNGAFVDAGNGACTTCGIFVGNFIDGDAVLNVDGPGSQLDAIGFFVVGAANDQDAPGTTATGTVNVLNGGIINSESVSISEGNFDDPTLTSTGTVVIDGVGSQWNAPNFNVSVNDGTTGIVQVTNGGTLNLTDFLSIAPSINSVGRVDVIGPGSQLTTGFVGVGDAGDGSFNILGGGLADVGGTVSLGNTDPNSVGAVTVSGNNSILRIGNSLNIDGPGSGTVLIDNGGTLEVGNSLNVGFFSVAGAAIDVNNGTVTMDAGPDGPFTQFNVGFVGNGSAIIDNGSVVTIGNTSTNDSFGRISLGFATTNGDATGDMLIDGAGTQVNIGSGGLALLQIGIASLNGEATGPGIGTLDVTGGAEVNLDGVAAGSLSLARGGNSQGTLNISGAGTTMNINGGGAFIFIGNDFSDAVGDGDAFVNITDGATINVDGLSQENTNVFVGSGSGNGNLLVDTGGALNIDGTFHVSAATANNDTQTGTAIIGPGGVVNTIDTIVGNRGVLTGDGLLNTQTLTVQPGGLFDMSDLSGIASLGIDGAGSLFAAPGGNLSVGQPAGQSLNVVNGGVATVLDTAFFGDGLGNQGSGSVATGGSLTVGSVDGAFLGVGTNGGVGSLLVDSATVDVSALDGTVFARIHIGEGGTGDFTITNGGSVTVVDGQNQGSDDGLFIGRPSQGIAGAGTMTIDGSDLTVTSTTAFINVGTANTPFTGPGQGTGTLDIMNGATVTLDGTTGLGLLGAGRGGGSLGTINVTGANTMVNIGGAQAVLAIANDFTDAVGDGDASMTISDGAAVNVVGTTPGTGFAFIGSGTGNGALTVNSGASLFIDGDLLISLGSQNNNTQTGTVSVTDTGSVTSNRIIVGERGLLSGDGQVSADSLFLVPGGVVTLEDTTGINNFTVSATQHQAPGTTLAIGNAATQTYTVNQNGTISVNGDLIVGSGGNGVLVATDGGMVDILGDLLIGPGDDGSTGIVTLEDTGVINTQATTVGTNGTLEGAGLLNTGTLTVLAGGTLNLDRLDGVAELSLSGAGSSLTLNNTLNVGGAASNAFSVTDGASGTITDGTVVDANGTLTVSGAGSTFDSTTLDVANGGSVFINDQATFTSGATTIGNGGFLGGTGTLVSPTVSIGAGGTLAAGLSPGTFDVVGDLSLDGGTIVFEMGGLNPGEFDFLDIDGNLALNAGAVNFDLINGFAPDGGESINIIRTTGNLTVGPDVGFMFNGLGPDFMFDVQFALDPVLGQQVGQGIVTFLGIDIEDTPGVTGNQNSMAAGLDDLCPRIEALVDPTPAEADLDLRCGNLRNAANTPDQIGDGLDAITPDEVTGTINTLLQFTTVQHGNLSQRLSGLRSGASRIDVSGINLQFDGGYIAGTDLQQFFNNLTGANASADEDFARWGFFGNADINFGDRDETENNPGFDFETINLTLGADYRINNNLFVGGAVGYSEVNSDFDVGGGILVKSVVATLIATYFNDSGFYVDGILTYGENESETSRHVIYEDIGGPINRRARGEADGYQFVTGFGTGYDFTRGAWIFGPHAGATYSEVAVEAFEEEGALGLNLSIPEQVARSMTGNIGAHVSYTLTPDWGVLVPYARIDYVHEFKDDIEVADIQFVNDRFRTDPTDPTMPIAIESDPIDGSYGVWSVGLNAQFINGIAGFINYRSNEGLDDMDIGYLTWGMRFERRF